MSAPAGSGQWQPGPCWGCTAGLQDLRDLAALGNLGAQGCRLGCRLRLYVVTARGGPAVQRVATSMQAWGLRPDGIHYLNGTDKQRSVGDTLQADVFSDDQLRHLQPVQHRLLAVHVPGLEAPVGDT